MQCATTIGCEATVPVPFIPKHENLSLTCRSEYVLILAALWPQWVLGAQAKAALPNIVYILADDLGYGDVACYNRHSKIPTPHLDRLAAEGIRLTDVHDPTAVCTPTRYSILTGRCCWRIRLQRGVLPQWSETLIEPGRLTVPALLKSRGYHTAAFGKWHLGWRWTTTDGQPARFADGKCNVDFTKPLREGPVAQGFDYFFGNDAPFHPPYCFIENDRIVGLPTEILPLARLQQMQQEGKVGPLETRPGPMIPGWDLFHYLPEVTSRCAGYIESRAAQSPRRPFFIYLALPSPHTPIVPSPEFRGKSQAGIYGDWVYQTDWSIGQVLAALERSGLMANTLVIATSDNGPEKFAYERIREFGHYSMGDLRGVKRDAWEGGHRVPFIARWPGKIRPGSVCNEVVCQTDLMATCAAIVGARLPDNAGEDSYNILPALLGEKLEKPIREATVMHSASGRFAIRQGPWLLIASPTGDDNKEPDWFKQERGYRPHSFPGELYQLSDDLAERRNLYGERPEVVDRLGKLLQRYIDQGRSTPGTPQPNDVPVQR